MRQLGTLTPGTTVRASSPSLKFEVVTQLVRNCGTRALHIEEQSRGDNRYYIVKFASKEDAEKFVKANPSIATGIETISVSPSNDLRELISTCAQTHGVRIEMDATSVSFIGSPTACANAALALTNLAASVTLKLSERPQQVFFTMMSKSDGTSSPLKKLASNFGVTWNANTRADRLVDTMNFVGSPFKLSQLMNTLASEFDSFQDRQYRLIQLDLTNVRAFQPDTARYRVLAVRILLLKQKKLALIIHH